MMQCSNTTAFKYMLLTIIIDYINGWLVFEYSDRHYVNIVNHRPHFIRFQLCCNEVLVQLTL